MSNLSLKHITKTYPNGFEAVKDCSRDGALELCYALREVPDKIGVVGNGHGRCCGTGPTGRQAATGIRRRGRKPAAMRVV